MPTPKTNQMHYKGELIELYNKDSKYFNLPNGDIDKHKNVNDSFTVVRDPYTGILYKVPLKGIEDKSVYHNDLSANYIDDPNAKFNYDYIYYIKECVFDQYKIPNIVQRIQSTDNYCSAECMNYRSYDFGNYPPNIINQRDRTIYDSNCLIFWAPIIAERISPYMEKGRYWASTAGTIWDSKLNCPGRIIPRDKGYFDFEFGCNGRKYLKKKLHRVIMLTFSYYPGCENLEVNHIDGNHSNNRITNLEWVTHDENVQHAIDNEFLLYQRCEKEYGITYKEYLNNKCLEHYGMTQSEVGRDREARKRNVRS